MNGTTLTTPTRIVPGVASIDSRVSSTQQVADGRLFVRIARTAEDVEAALKLRFEVFNLELGEGLASAFRTGRECDEFDSHSEHLIIADPFQSLVIGPADYEPMRLQKRPRAFVHPGNSTLVHYRRKFWRTRSRWAGFASLKHTVTPTQRCYF